MRSLVLRGAFISLCVLAGALGWSTVALAAAPTITHVNPDSGAAAGGTSVTIEGTGFVSGATVKFGEASATAVSVKSSTSLSATSPAGTGTINVAVTDSNGTSAAVSHDWFAYEPAPGGQWLGLNGNSVSNKATEEWLGPINAFSQHGIVYDRNFELPAGELPNETESDGKGGTYFEDELKYDHEAGMIPVSVIEYDGYTGGKFAPDPYFPRSERTTEEKAAGKTTIKEYVEGFVTTASAILKLVSERYPGMPVLFEPMNEPWGYTEPTFNGAEYANVIAQLLPKAQEDGIPLNSVYVAAFGNDCTKSSCGNEANCKLEGKEVCTSNGWIPAMYAAQPTLESKVEGWYFHPYGPASGAEFGDSYGIQSVPEVRKKMTSGQNNIIVSEVGYCAQELGSCNPPEVETGPQAATFLTEMLDHALPYYEEGWLKALLVYSRDAGGWTMQVKDTLKDSLLTAQGQALDNFAFSLQPPTYSSVFGTSGSGKLDGPYLDAVDASGDVWVVDAGDDRLVEFSSSGSFIRSVGSKGEGNGQFRLPFGIAINHATGDVYVTDVLNKDVQEFSSTGEFITAFGHSGEGALEYPYGVALDSAGDVWVVRGIGGTVEEFSPTGGYLDAIHTEDGQLSDLTFADGDLYVLGARGQVQEYTPTGTYLGQFGAKGAGAGQLSEPFGITTDPANGDLYVADTGNHRVEAFTPTGTYLNTFGSEGTGTGQFKEPAGIAINNGGELYVTDHTNNGVEQLVTKTLASVVNAPTYSSVFGTSGSGKLDGPYLDAIDASGNVWVVDAGDDRLVEFLSSGAFVRSVGSEGEGDGHFRLPFGIAINHQTGDIYVTDVFNKRIQEFSSTGEFITAFYVGEGALEYPYGITLDSAGDVWVIRGIGGALEEFSSTGSSLRTIHTEDGELSDLAFSGGNLYVLGNTRGQVQEYTPTGAYLGQFGTKGTGAGQLSEPFGITTDPVNGNLCVADTGNHRIEVFTPTGTYLNTFGSEGTGPGQFKEPAGIAINNGGELYVTDHTNNRVEQWLP